MIKILTDQATDFLEANATKLDLGNGDEWFYSPYWFRRVEGNTFEQVSFEKLPEKVIKTVRELRGLDSKNIKT